MEISRRLHYFIMIMKNEIQTMTPWQEVLVYMNEHGIAHSYEPLEHKVQLFLFLEPADPEVNAHLHQLELLIAKSLKDGDSFKLNG